MSNEYVLYLINSMILYIIFNFCNKKNRYLKIFNCKLFLIKNMKIINCNLFIYIDKRLINSLNIVCELNVFSICK